MKKLYAFYFSPTGGTRHIVNTLASALASRLMLSVEEIDYTGPDSRRKLWKFSNEDIVVLGMPTYAGRIPNKILPDLEDGLMGSGSTKVIPVSVFGNRSQDEALRELILLSLRKGFLPIAAAACVSRHAFSPTLASGRPDQTDLAELTAFGERVAAKISAGKETLVSIDLETPIGPYYTPLREDGAPARFLKAVPVTDMGACTGCGLCARLCPMGSISKKDFSSVEGICIKCQACVRACPVGAKFFDDEEFLSHVRMLEGTYSSRKENLFLEN